MVRVSLETYAKLAETAGKLQFRLRHRVSLSDALDYLVHKKNRQARRFWSKLKEKRAKKRLGRGAQRVPATPESPPSVHTNTNHRIEVS